MRFIIRREYCPQRIRLDWDFLHANIAVADELASLSESCIYSPDGGIEAMHTKAERAKSRKRRSIIVATMGVLCILGLIAALRPSSPPTAKSSAALDLTQHFILAPTNGVLTQILAGVGEHVDASAPLVQLGDPIY